MPTGTETFAKRLQMCRVNSGMNKRELGDMVGLAPGNIGKYENGTTVPRLDSAFKLAKALGYTLNELTGVSKLEFPEMKSNQDKAPKR